MPFSLIHDMEKQGFPNLYTVTWNAIIFHQETAKMICKLVSRKISAVKAPLKLSYLRTRASYDRPFIDAVSQVSEADICWAVEKEHARDLVVILFARTGLAWYTALSAADVRRAASLVAPLLNWTDANISQEVQIYLNYVERNHMP